MGRLFYVYIVRCSDDALYTGITNDLDRRVWEHNEGFDAACYTFERRPVHLLWSASFHNASIAIDWEKKIKGWSRRKKLALIAGDWNRISALSRGKNRSERRPSTSGLRPYAQDDGV